MREFNASDDHWAKAAPVSPELELGELLEQILIRYAAEAERRRCCRPGKGEMRMLANGA